MNIRNRKDLKSFAAQRLAHTESAGKITLIYTGLILGLAAVATIVNYLLQLQISRSGGLGNLGVRTALSTVQTMLPVVQAALALCVDLGYLAAMLRVCWC